MTWAPLLLADSSPCLRWRVLRELLGRSQDDPEVAELDRLRVSDPLVMDILSLQQSDGSWKNVDLSGVATVSTLQATAQALLRLGYLGFGPDLPAVSRGAEFLFAQQQVDGSWLLPEGRQESEDHAGYSMVPLQTSLPLRGLAACGYSTDPRAERAYEWLLAQRLEDGAWPTGWASGVHGFVAGYRRLAHSRWGCRSNTTGALSCLALHPMRRSSLEAQRALDLLLGRETRDQFGLGFEVARLLGAEKLQGFFTTFARFDLAQMLDLCWRVGASLEDERIASMVAYVQSLQGSYGLWEYSTRPQVSRWVTFDLLRSLSQLDRASDWVSLEPSTPFKAYTRKFKRY